MPANRTTIAADVALTISPHFSILLFIKRKSRMCVPGGMVNRINPFGTDGATAKGVVVFKVAAQPG